MEVLTHPGVEISLEYKGPKVGGRSGWMHLLVYHLPLDGPLAEELREMQAWRAARNHRIIAKLCELGLEMTLDEVAAASGGGQIGRAAPPRLLEEIFRVFRPGRSVAAVRLLREAGLLDVLFPEIADYLANGSGAPATGRVAAFEALSRALVAGFEEEYGLRFVERPLGDAESEAAAAMRECFLPERGSVAIPVELLPRAG